MEGFSLNPRKQKLIEQREKAKVDANSLIEILEERELDEGEQAQLTDLKAEIDSLQRRIDGIDALYSYDPGEPLHKIDGLQITKTRIEPQGPVIETDPKRGFADMGQFAHSVFSASQPGARMDDRLSIQAAISGMGQNIGSDGGFLVPPAFSTAIWDGMSQEPDNLLGMTDGYTVTGESLTLNANAETSRVAGSRYGGIRGYWIAEAAQITSSKPTLRQIKIEPQQLAVLVYVTDKLLKNATALDQYVTRAAQSEITFMVSDAIINGDGVGKPLGVLNAGCLVPVAKETGQAAATVVSQNIHKMFARCHARMRRNAVWFINQDIEPQLNQMSLDVGTGGMPGYLPPGGLSASPYATLLGRPVMPLESCATIGTVGDIILADLSAYATGTQGGVDSAMSMHLRFDYAETAFRFMFAVDGKPWLASALTPFKGTNTLSPFVALATRA